MALALELGGDDLVDVEEAVLLEADLDERGLHAGQHVVDDALVDVPGDRVLLGPLEVDLGDAVVLEDGDALLADVDRDEELALRGRQRRAAGRVRRRRLAAAARCGAGRRSASLLLGPLLLALLGPFSVPGWRSRSPPCGRRLRCGRGRRGSRGGVRGGLSGLAGSSGVAVATGWRVPALHFCCFRDSFSSLDFVPTEPVERQRCLLLGARAYGVPEWAERALLDVMGKNLA